MEEISSKFRFHIFENEYLLDILRTYGLQYKVRLYLLSAQNISAVDNKIDLKSKLAGMSSMCTANPYPVVQIGDSSSKHTKSKIRMFDDKQSCKEGDLNPQYLTKYELDAQLPEDWKLELSIFHKRGGLYPLLIGSTIVDLENRRHSNLLWQNRSMCIIEQKNLDKLKQQNVKKNKEKLKYFDKRRTQLRKIYTELQ